MVSSSSTDLGGSNLMHFSSRVAGVTSSWQCNNWQLKPFTNIFREHVRNHHNLGSTADLKSSQTSFSDTSVKALHSLIDVLPVLRSPFMSCVVIVYSCQTNWCVNHTDAITDDLFMKSTALLGVRGVTMHRKTVKPFIDHKQSTTSLQHQR